MKRARPAEGVAEGVPEEAGAKKEEAHQRIKKIKSDDLEKEKADFGLSGLLQKELANDECPQEGKLKWVEPPDAATPVGKSRWQLFVFEKGSSDKPAVITLDKQSAFLVGRDSKLADICIRDASVSKQHAVLQFRMIPNQENPNKVYIKPYILDLDSTNGTTINREDAKASHYVQLFPKDILRFGNNENEYILLKQKAT